VNSGPKHRRRPLFLAAAAIAVFALTGASRAHAEAQLLVDADTGKVLYAENATYPWYPASVTKLMTAYTTLRAVKEGRVRMDSLLTVSRNAVAQQPTKMGFREGTTVTVDNALKMLMVKSANDIAVVLAEGIGGSIEGFADQMNANARRLGMTQTHYVNPNGLPAEDHITSARDLAILARALIREFPQYDSYWHISAIRYGKRVFRNYNTLIDRYPGADGMKTGFICASGFNLVASATRNGKRLIAVVLGAYSSAVRAQKAATLMERGFNSAGLSWLTPSLGNVEALVPIDAQPPNLRDEMCGGHRRKPPSEENDEQEVNAGDSASSQALGFAGTKAATEKYVLPAATHVGETITVYTGPANNPDKNDAVAASKTKSHKKKTAKGSDGDKKKTAKKKKAHQAASADTKKKSSQ
jgi:D-alanyl-D-alanine carboxypeptidase